MRMDENAIAPDRFPDAVPLNERGGRYHTNRTDVVDAPFGRYRDHKWKIPAQNGLKSGRHVKLRSRQTKNEDHSGEQVNG